MGLYQDHEGSGKFFALIRIVAGDGGKWLRKQYLLLAQHNMTPVFYWESMPLYELSQWIDSTIEIIDEKKAALANRHR